MKNNMINNIKYKIELTYRTGNSFGSVVEIELLELDWENFEVAKENLLRIKEHYEMYQEIDDLYNSNKINNVLKNNKHKDWFVNEPILFNKNSNEAIDEKDKKKFGEDNCEYIPDKHLATHCLKLKTDNGNVMQLSAFWTGCFELLYEIEIKAEFNNNEDIKIRFN